MTDLEMTKACAEAMGYRISDDSKFEESGLWCHLPAQHGEWYRPLSGDTYGNAQAMALLKRFNLMVNWNSPTEVWCMPMDQTKYGHLSDSPNCADLNRAIVECVSELAAKQPLQGTVK